MKSGCDIFPVASRSVDDTRQAGAALSAYLEVGDIVALQGDLGTGKTEFVRGFCQAYGIDRDEVTSPTFTIVNEYAASGLAVFHIDAYRLKSEAEFFDLGYEDYFLGEAVSFIEWPERLPTILAGNDIIRMHFEHLGGNERRITMGRR